MMIDALLGIVSFFRAPVYDWAVFVECFTDLVCGGGVIFYIALVFPTRISSAETVSSVVKNPVVACSQDTSSSR